jgi:hypothetical protein
MKNYFTDEQLKQLFLAQGLHGDNLITSPWDDGIAFEDLKSLINLAVSTAIGEPKAWVAFADNENLRIWTLKKDQVARLSEQVNFPLSPLYAVKELPNG